MSEAPAQDRFDLSTPLGRAMAYADYLWNDHAYLRLGFSNAHWISEELVRANQPWPHQIAAWKARGIRSMLPHVDELRPIHNLDAMGDLVRALSTHGGRAANPKEWLEKAA